MKITPRRSHIAAAEFASHCAKTVHYLALTAATVWAILHPGGAAVAAPVLLGAIACAGRIIAT